MPSLVEIGSVVLEKKIFKCLSMYFSFFTIITPWKRAGPFIWTKLNPLYPKMLWAKFGWNWPSGSWEVENRKSLQTDGQTDRQTDDGRKAIRNAHLSFQLRWATKHLTDKQSIKQNNIDTVIIEKYLLQYFASSVLIQRKNISTVLMFAMCCSLYICILMV